MNTDLQKDAVLRIGEVSEIIGRTVFITVDKNKNASDLVYNGVLIKNISVGAYIEIRKGFLSIIGKIEGEKLLKEKYIDEKGNEYQIIDKNKRFLSITLCGYINSNGKFIGGIKELPLMGNEAFLITEEKINIIHNLVKSNTTLKISIAKTEIDEIPVHFPIDGLFNSHIAIFGNTGSGKSQVVIVDESASRPAIYIQNISTGKEWTSGAVAGLTDGEILSSKNYRQVVTRTEPMFDSWGEEIGLRVYVRGV